MFLTFGGEQQKAFLILLDQFVQWTMLCLEKPKEISVDTSGTAAGALVVQDGKIVRIFSKKFNAAQSKYNSTRREDLALLRAMVRNAVVWTDRQPLERFVKEILRYKMFYCSVGYALFSNKFTSSLLRWTDESTLNNLHLHDQFSR
jgi:hypothetical protein